MSQTEQDRAEFVETPTEYDDDLDTAQDIVIKTEELSEQARTRLAQDLSLYLEENVPGRSSVILDRHDGSARPNLRWDSEVDDEEC
jgi:hypothetical protein